MAANPSQPDEWIGGVVIPTYRHVTALPAIVERVCSTGLRVLIVDDGNEPGIAASIAALHAPEAGVTVIRRELNGGKGAAVKAGLRAAASAGWSHAIQIDADGQHDLNALPLLIEASKAAPMAMVCGVPRYDDTIPSARKFGRNITHFWVWVETLSRDISDSMCGFRVYPLADTIAVLDRETIGDRMDFDTEILVHMHWRGLRFVELPVTVTYPEENISNFRMLKDNVAISWMHTRLAIQAPVRVPIRIWRRASRSGSAA